MVIAISHLHRSVAGKLLEDLQGEDLAHDGIVGMPEAVNDQVPAGSFNLRFLQSRPEMGEKCFSPNRTARIRTVKNKVVRIFEWRELFPV